MKLSEFFCRSKLHKDGEITKIDVSEDQNLVKVSARFPKDVTDHDIYFIHKEIKKSYKLDNLDIEPEYTPKKLSPEEVFNYIFEETWKKSFVGVVEEFLNGQHNCVVDVYGTRQSYSVKISIYHFKNFEGILEKVKQMIENKWIDEFAIDCTRLILEGSACYK